MSKILIAFDPSTKSTGYAVFKDQELIKYGAFEENSKEVLERINNLSNKTEELINKYQPNDMAIENVQITMSAPTAKVLLGLQLLLELKAYNRKIPYSLIRPTHWRKVLGLSNSSKLKRAEKKKEAIQYVVNKYNVPEDSADDICDAICIGECYLKENNNEG